MRVVIKWQGLTWCPPESIGGWCWLPERKKSSKCQNEAREMPCWCKGIWVWCLFFWKQLQSWDKSYEQMEFCHFHVDCICVTYFKKEDLNKNHHHHSMHRDDKNTIASQFYMGTNVFSEISAPRVNFLYKGWNLKSYFCKNYLMVLDGSSSVAMLVIKTHFFLLLESVSK